MCLYPLSSTKWADLSSSYPHWLLGYYPASSPIRQPLSPKTDKNISRSHFFLTFFLLSFSLSLSHFGCSLSLSSHLTNGVQHQLRLFQEFLGVGRGLHCIGPTSLWRHQTIAQFVAFTKLLISITQMSNFRNFRTRVLSRHSSDTETMLSCWDWCTNY